jgi:hypothetical protein
MGVLPDQLPGLAVSTEPSRGVPEMVGGEVFDGAVPGPPITPVVARADALPSALRAVTKKMSRRPRSSGVSLYDREVAPVIVAQFATCELQRIHWYVNVTGAVPDQPPGFPVRVCPTRWVPEIVGGDVFRGAAVGAAVSAAPDVAPIAARTKAPTAAAATATRVCRDERRGGLKLTHPLGLDAFRRSGCCRGCTLTLGRNGQGSLCVVARLLEVSVPEPEDRWRSSSFLERGEAALRE